MKCKPLDLAPRIFAYEAGELNSREAAVLFQDLVDSGMIDHLQGTYQRVALTLMAAGVIKAPRIEKKGG